MYKGTAAKDLISSLEMPFKEVATRYKTIDDIVFTRYDYRKDLSKDLDQKKSYGASLLRKYMNDARAHFRNNLTIHLEAVDDARKANADRMEVLQAHDLYKLNPNGWLRSEIAYYASKGPFFAGWLEDMEYLPPPKWENESDEDWTKRAERHKNQFFGFQILSRDPYSVAYMESNRKLTMASCRVRIPYVDVMERYGKSYGATRDDPDHMLKIAHEHFPGIRADEGYAADYSSQGFWDKEAEICIVADHNKIWHYMDLGDGKYEACGEGEYDNALGDVPLLLCEGVYNPHEELAYRREGILHSLIEIEHTKAFYKSFWASVTSSPQRMYEEMPEQVSLAILEDPENKPPDFEFTLDTNGRPKIGRSLGTIRAMPRELDALMEKVYQIAEMEGRVAAPQGVLSDPDASQRLQNIPVSSVLAQQDSLADLLGEAQRSETNMWNRGLDMLMHARKYKLNSHRKEGDKGSDLDWNSSFKASGEEKVKGKKILAGTSYEVTPQDYDGEYTRSIEPVDDRSTTRSAQRAEATSAWQQGTMTYDKYLEAYGIENITEFKTTKYKESMFQIEAPRLMMEVRMNVAQIGAVMSGAPIEQQLIGLSPEMGSQLAGAFAQQEGLGTGSNMNMVQVASPQSQKTGQDVTSEAQL
jgi:hypothetical protein